MVLACNGSPKLKCRRPSISTPTPLLGQNEDLSNSDLEFLKIVMKNNVDMKFMIMQNSRICLTNCSNPASRLLGGAIELQPQRIPDQSCWSCPRLGNISGRATAPSGLRKPTSPPLPHQTSHPLASGCPFWSRTRFLSPNGPPFGVLRPSHFHFLKL